MEIVVERIAKKETYTIGRLYLLADGDELPHLAPSSDESHPGGRESGRRHLDYHHLISHNHHLIFGLSSSDIT